MLEESRINKKCADDGQQSCYMFFNQLFYNIFFPVSFFVYLCFGRSKRIPKALSPLPSKWVSGIIFWFSFFCIFLPTFPMNHQTYLFLNVSLIVTLAHKLILSIYLFIDIKVFHSNLQYLLDRFSFCIIIVIMGLLLTQNVMEAVFLHKSREIGKASYIMTTAIITTELIKIIISILALLFKGFSFLDIGTYLQQQKLLNDWLPLIIPSVLYAIQNNLRFVALSYLHPSTYQVLLQGKIISTAFFTTRILGRKLHRIQWISLVNLTAGLLLVCEIKRKHNSTPKLHNHTNMINENVNSKDMYMLGIISVLGIALCSGLASVYTEKIIKGNGNRSIYLLNIQLSLLGLLTNSVYLGYSHSPMIFFDPYQFWGGYTIYIWIVVCLTAFGGILVGLVIQYTSSLAKTYLLSCALLINTMIDSYFSQTGHISFTFIVATVIIFCSVLLFNDPANKIDNNTKPATSKII